MGIFNKQDFEVDYNKACWDEFTKLTDDEIKNLNKFRKYLTNLQKMKSCEVKPIKVKEPKPKKIKKPKEKKVKEKKVKEKIKKNKYIPLGKLVYCFELDKIFNSISEASRETGKTCGTIRYQCQNYGKERRIYSSKYTFKFVERKENGN